MGMGEEGMGKQEEAPEEEDLAGDDWWLEVDMGWWVDGKSSTIAHVVYIHLATHDVTYHLI